MNVKEAMKIMHPDTTSEALSEIEYFAGFKGHEAKVQAVCVASIIAAAALQKQETILPEKKDDGYRYCAVCGKVVGDNANYCKNCGQLIVDEEESPFEIAILQALENMLIPEKEERREDGCYDWTLDKE